MTFNKTKSGLRIMISINLFFLGCNSNIADDDYIKNTPQTEVSKVIAKIPDSFQKGECFDNKGTQTRQGVIYYPYPPKHFRIKLTLNSQVPSCTRYIKFVDYMGNAALVPIIIKRDYSQSGFYYTGETDQTGLNALDMMSQPNNRSYWDKMFITNPGGEYGFDIKLLEIWISYDSIYNESSLYTMWIGRLADAKLGGWGTLTGEPKEVSVPWDDAVSRWAVHTIWGYWSRTYFWDYAEPFKKMVYDLGKSGSDGVAHPPYTNYPKYHRLQFPEYLCSEAVAYYYHTENVVIYPNGNPFDFAPQPYGVYVCDQLYYAFRDAKRLYRYDSNIKAWCLVEPAPGGDVIVQPVKTYNPRPGDYFHINGHSMMAAKWDSNTGIMTGLQNPYPVSITKRQVHGSATTYWVGRLPEHDFMVNFSYKKYNEPGTGYIYECTGSASNGSGNYSYQWSGSNVIPIGATNGINALFKQSSGTGTRKITFTSYDKTFNETKSVTKTVG